MIRSKASDCLGGFLSKGLSPCSTDREQEIIQIAYPICNCLSNCILNPIICFYFKQANLVVNSKFFVLIVNKLCHRKAENRNLYFLIAVLKVIYMLSFGFISSPDNKVLNLAQYWWKFIAYTRVQNEAILLLLNNCILLSQNSIGNRTEVKEYLWCDTAEI